MLKLIFLDIARSKIIDNFVIFSIYWSRLKAMSSMHNKNFCNIINVFWFRIESAEEMESNLNNGDKTDNMY